MYRSHVDAHARSIEELTGEHPHRGKSMYIENQVNRTGIIDDYQLKTRRQRNPFEQRPVTIHWDNLPQNTMSGNYASSWHQPREQHAVGAHVMYSANQKMQHQQAYSQQRSQPHPSGRRPVGRYGSRPASDSVELLGGGQQAYKPGGSRAANMFKKAREHTDKYAVDDDAITPQSVQKARAGAPDYEPPLSTAKGRPQARPAARPVSKPVSRPAPASPQPQQPQQPYAHGYGTAPQATAQRQQSMKRQPSQPSPQPQSPYASDYGKPAQTRAVNPPTPKGPQYQTRAAPSKGQQSASIGCSWNDSPTKRFHSGVQPYEVNYNRRAQGWQSSYKDTLGDMDDNNYDPFAPRSPPRYSSAPKLDLTKSQAAKQRTAYTNKNQRAKGWKTVGLEEQDAEELFNPHRPSMSSLSSAFEEPRPTYGGQQRAAQPRASQPRQAQYQQGPPQQRPPQQRMSSAANYAAGTGSWGGMLESDDL
ncbi:uncharacterized protein [Diadema antillarum]|uniref:uncharacterized protein n=1 Tax=Diadema antillarum TaxID=105358 RepID=UPI003A839A49